LFILCPAQPRSSIPKAVENEAVSFLAVKDLQYALQKDIKKERGA